MPRELIIFIAFIVISNVIGAIAKHMKKKEAERRARDAELGRSAGTTQRGSERGSSARASMDDAPIASRSAEKRRGWGATETGGAMGPRDQPIERPVERSGDAMGAERRRLAEARRRRAEMLEERARARRQRGSEPSTGVQTTTRTQVGAPPIAPGTAGAPVPIPTPIPTPTPTPAAAAGAAGAAFDGLNLDAFQSPFDEARRERETSRANREARELARRATADNAYTRVARDRTATGAAFRARMLDRQALRDLIVMRELLEPPLALRNGPPGRASG